MRPRVGNENVGMLVPEYTGTVDVYHIPERVGTVIITIVQIFETVYRITPSVQWSSRLIFLTRLPSTGMYLMIALVKFKQH